VAETTSRRFELGFALGNLAPALVVGVSGYALPVRYFFADALVAVTVLSVVGSSGVALFRRDRALTALRVGALALLGFGLLVIAAAALSVAYLYGTQGDFGRGGLLIMVLVLFLSVPYLFAYPIIELFALHRRFAEHRAPSAVRGAEP